MYLRHWYCNKFIHKKVLFTPKVNLFLPEVNLFKLKLAIFNKKLLKVNFLIHEYLLFDTVSLSYVTVKIGFFINLN